MTQITTTGNIIDHLSADHVQIKALFSDVMFVRPESRDDVFCYLVTELVRHEVAEELVVYPEVTSIGPAGAKAAKPLLREQAEAEEMLARMETLDRSSPEFSDAVSELSIAVMRHAEAEEREIFPILRSAEDSGALFELAARYQKAKQAAPTHPHPHAPDTPPANRILGPIAGLFDRVRDVVGEHLKR
jgi:hemerythrin superfamily protein